MNTIGLLACAKGKYQTAQPAEQLYKSVLFRKAKQYAKKKYTCWYILSAKYNLVNPKTVLEPYNEILLDKSKSDRELWARNVITELVKLFPDSSDCEFYFHAGILYRYPLISLLEELDYICKEPLKGLRIGEQIKWYNDQYQEQIQM
ncbi:MAG: DUF6884 domain-containing protein [Candidatus Hodarchaeales archaeon]